MSKLHLFLIQAAMCAALLGLAPLARGDVQIILHAIDHPDRVHCYVPADAGYRDPVVDTRTAVEPNSEIDVFVFLRGDATAVGAGFRLLWPSEWEYFGWVGDCQPGASMITDFDGHWIDIAIVWEAGSGNDLLVLGYASFRTGANGEVAILNTRFCIEDGATCYLSGDLVEHPIPIPHLGRVAVGGPGYNPAAVTPVAASTWGAIKATYRD